MTSTTKVKADNFQSHNTTVIGFNFISHKELSTFESDIHFGRAASRNITFSGK